MRYFWIAILFGVPLLAALPKLDVEPPEKTPPPLVYSQSLKECRAVAVMDNKPIAVWVGFTCGYTALCCKEIVHYQHSEPSYKGVRGPCVIPMVKRGTKFWFYDRCVIRAGDCSVNHLRRMVRITRRDLGLCDCEDTKVCTCVDCRCPGCKYKRVNRIRAVPVWRPQPTQWRNMNMRTFCPT